MRIAILGAFPFPYPQGSQVYMEGQARALAKAGAEVLAITYGRGANESEANDLPRVTAPRWLSPRALRSGPRWGKPIGDAGLLAVFARAHRANRFDAVVAHNAEAALLALALRPALQVPVTYVAHTLLRHELSAYGPERAGSALERLGAQIDASVARRCDAVIALCGEAAKTLGELRGHAVPIVPPGHALSPPPDTATLERICARHGLELGRFALYAGNLDRYQDLPLLRSAVRSQHGHSGERPPVVLVTHDGSGADALVAGTPGLRCIEVAAFQDVRALSFAAGALVLPRRRVGGFPIKLLNYMETGRPIVAFARVAWGLEDGVSAHLLADDDGAETLADALDSLFADPATASQLGANARARLVEHHAWPQLARETLEVIACGIRARDRRLSSGM